MNVYLQNIRKLIIGILKTINWFCDWLLENACFDCDFFSSLLLSSFLYNRKIQVDTKYFSKAMQKIFTQLMV
jgi:hypothetical protein